MSPVTSSKKNNLFLILLGFFLANTILAEMIGVKIFSLEQTLGWHPAQIRLLEGFVLDFNLTAGVVIWPIVFITTDVINEYFGKEGVKKVTYLTASLIFYIFLVIWIITYLTPADFWLEINSTDNDGNSFDINFAFNRIFRQGSGIIIGSLVAFLIGQLLDVYVFHKLRKITGSKMIWVRATGSTLVSQFVDSFVVLFIAFYILAPSSATWSLEQVISVGIINYIYKFGIAILTTPALYLIHFIIDRYLGKELAHQTTKEAASKSEGFF